MRNELKNSAGKRIKVFAQVSRFGKKKAYKGPPIDTIYLVNLVDATGNKVCDHLWLTVGKQIVALNLEEGDKICFMGRVKKYTNGYRGNRDDLDDYKPISEDYKLSNPTGFSKSGSAACGTTLFDKI